MTNNIINYIYQNDVDAIAFSTIGQYTLGGKAVVEHTHTRELVRVFPDIIYNLGFKLKETSTNIPYIVGVVGQNFNLIKGLDFSDLKNKNYKCLLISCPIKNKIKEEINFQLLRQSIAVIEDYVKSFNLNKVIVSAPQIKTIDNIIFI